MHLHVLHSWDKLLQGKRRISVPHSPPPSHTHTHTPLSKLGEAHIHDCTSQNYMYMYWFVFFNMQQPSCAYTYLYYISPLPTRSYDDTIPGKIIVVYLIDGGNRKCVTCGACKLGEVRRTSHTTSSRLPVILYRYLTTANTVLAHTYIISLHRLLAT